jgi:hypothetical protein
MDWTLSGRLAGACNCGTPCPCWFGQAPTHGTCDSIGVGIVEQGDFHGVDLAGCKLGVAYRTAGHVWEGGLQLAIYIDERTPPPQSEALGTILTGQAGGLIQRLFTLVGDFKGIKRAHIEIDDLGSKRSFKLGPARVPLSPVLGGDRTNPVSVDNAVMAFGGERLLATTESTFSDPELGWQWELRHADFGPMNLAVP